MNTLYQPGIFEPVPAVARYVAFALTEQGRQREAVQEALRRLSPLANGSDVVLGIGPALVAALGDVDREPSTGRRLAGNEEIEDSPVAAHVKRTAQESSEPTAFILRRSMPGMMSMQAGLMFVAFGQSLYAFEAQMRRMAGED